MFKVINIASGRVEAVSYCAKAARAWKRRFGGQFSTLYSPEGQILRG